MRMSKHHIDNINPQIYTKPCVSMLQAKMKFKLDDFNLV